MENQKKIIHFLLWMFLVVSCDNQSVTKIDQKDTADQPLYAIKAFLGCIVVEDGQRIFRVNTINALDSKVEGYYSIENSTAHFKCLINLSGDTLSVHQTIDSSTFRVIGLSKDEKLKIRNPYFFDGRMNCYYKDKNYFYVYLDQANPSFFILDKVENVELIGGDYLRNADKIFKSGNQIPGAIAADFHTMETFQMKSEWQRTIGMDHKHIYAGPKALTNARFDKLLEGYDSIQKVYFPDEIFIFTEN